VTETNTSVSEVTVEPVEAVEEIMLAEELELESVVVSWCSKLLKSFKLMLLQKPLSMKLLRKSLLHNKTLFMKLRAKLMQKFWQLRSQFLILEDDVVFMGSSSMLKSTTREMIPTIWLSFSQV
jgi:hypothetical protein